MNYRFFDYKYSIEGYCGQDFESWVRYGYMAFCLILIPIAVFLLRKTRHERMTAVFRFLSVGVILMETAKITWESWWDIRLGYGFNAGGILPLDTCSLFLFLLPVAGFARGKAHECASAWLATLGLAGGLSNVLFPQALKWYPVLTFGATVSLIHHALMLFVALWIVVTGYHRFRPADVGIAFLPHAVFSVPVIAADYRFRWDYMLYSRAGGVPLIETAAGKLDRIGMNWVTTLMMILIYFLLAWMLSALYARCQRQKATVRDDQ